MTNRPTLWRWIYRTFLVLAVVFGPCGCRSGQDVSGADKPANPAQYREFQRQLRYWKPFVDRLNYLVALPVSGQPDEVYLSALGAVAQAPIRYFSARAGADFDLSRGQVRDLNRLYAYSTALRKTCRKLLDRYQRMPDGRQGFSPSFLRELEQANRAARQFVATWQALVNRKNFADAPQDFNWYLDKR